MMILGLVIILIGSGVLINKHLGLVNITNPVIPMYYYHVVFFFLALIYAERYDHIMISEEVVLMVLYGFSAMFISALSMGRILGVKQGWQISSLYLSDILIRPSNFMVVVILQTIVLLMVLLFYMQKGVLILADDADNYRVEARKGLGYLVVIFRWMSEMFVVIGTLALFSNKKNSILFRSIFYIYYIVTIVFMLGFGSRAFVMELLLITIAIYYWSRNLKIDYKLIVLGFLFFSFLGVVGVFRQGLDVGGDMVFEKALWRPFVNIQNFQWIVDDFNNYGFLYGKSFLIELETLLPGYQPNFGTWYKNEFEYVFSGGSVTMTYLGEAYANFGVAGVFIMPVLIGCGVAIITYLLQRKMSFNWLLISIMSSLSLKGIINVGVGATLIGTLLPVIFCLGFFFAVKAIVEIHIRRSAH